MLPSLLGRACVRNGEPALHGDTTPLGLGMSALLIAATIYGLSVWTRKHRIMVLLWKQPHVGQHSHLLLLFNLRNRLWRIQNLFSVIKMPTSVLLLTPGRSSCLHTAVMWRSGATFLLCSTWQPTRVKESEVLLTGPWRCNGLVHTSSHKQMRARFISGRPEKKGHVWRHRTSWHRF